ncbi:penicillin-binding protein 4-like isoform X2 [Mya arenaria]|uniref:penicillin-binding protein 4-like isoform X2 n=1 Tax=Mya arenaria TaxID=6604 RepID=UPI0022E84041|nr:penicillin-binding protein 4-like isoform X2 [Mya arenaria]
MRYVLRFFVATLVLTSARDEVFVGETEQDVVKVIQATLECRHVPGMTVGIFKENDTWTRGFGTADLKSGRPVDEDTLFNIGSVTKSFTMALLAIMLKENKLQWTAKISDILGSEYGFIDDYRTRETTLRDLLSHRTGLASPDIGFMAGFPSSISREDLCKDSFIYNNYMYMLLGHVAEKLGGDTWENLVSSRIFIPLGMKSTKILKKTSDVLSSDMAHPYIYKDDMFENSTLDIYELHPAEPAGAILSSAEDMVRYFQFVLNNGNTTTGDQLTDPKLFSEAFSAAIPVNREKVTVSKPTFPISDVQVGYGSAWFESSYDGYRAVWHSGALWSYITLVWLFPETNIGIFISTNGGMFKDYQSKSLTTTMYFLADILLDKEPWLNSSTACSFPLPWKEVNETDPRLTEIPAFLPDISEYAGIYGNEFQPDFILTVSGSSQTQLNFESGIIGGNLYSTQDKERFLMEITYPWEFYVPLTDHNNVTTKTNVTFVREVGTVTSMILNFGTNITYTKDVSILDVISRNTNGSCRLFSAAWLIVYLLATCVVWLKYNQRI